MSKKQPISEVDQFSAWNNKLDKLLREADEKLVKDATVDNLDDIDKKVDTEHEFETEITDSPAFKKFKEIGSDLGNGLYGMIPYNSLRAVWTANADAKPNSDIIKIISDAIGHSYSLPMSNHDAISDKRIVPLIILTDLGDSIEFIANPKANEIRFSPKLNEIDLTSSQKSTLKKLETVAKKWMESVPDYVPRHVNRPGTINDKVDKRWGENERKLLDMIENRGYVEQERFADVVKWAGPEKEKKYDEIFKKLQAQALANKNNKIDDVARKKR